MPEKTDAEILETIKAIVEEKMGDFRPYSRPDASQDYINGGWEVLSSLAEPLGLSTVQPLYVYGQDLTNQ